jgi:hypothetical protein
MVITVKCTKGAVIPKQITLTKTVKKTMGTMVVFSGRRRAP